MEQDKKLEEIKRDTSLMATKVKKLKVATTKDMVKASELLGAIKSRIKRIEEIRLTYTKPLNEALKKINSDFKGAMKPLEEMESEIKRAIIDFRTEEEKKRRVEEDRLRKIEEERLRKEAKEKKISAKKLIENTPMPIVERQPNQIQTSQGVVKARMITKFRIIDESKVPDKYWVIDESLIRQDIRSGLMQINGVEVYQEEQLAV